MAKKIHQQHWNRCPKPTPPSNTLVSWQVSGMSCFHPCHFIPIRLQWDILYALLPFTRRFKGIPDEPE